MTKWLVFTAMLLALLPTAALAAGPEAGQLYIVQADDRLNRLAEKFYGNPQAAPLIVAATNSFTIPNQNIPPITTPEALPVGQPLVIPPVADVSLALQALADAQGAPTPAQQALLKELPALGQPPELFNEVWLNSGPLRLADLRGQVVLLDFWTFV